MPPETHRSDFRHTFEVAPGTRFSAVDGLTTSSNVPADYPVPHVGCTSILGKDLLRGDQRWTFLLRDSAGEREVGFGALRRGSIGTSLDICVLPGFSHGDALWAGLDRFADSLSVTHMLVESIGVPPNKTVIPALKGEQQRYSDVKLYVMRLAQADWSHALSSNHRRNIRKAQKEGVEVGIVAGDEAMAAHFRLIGASLQRRANRGEPTNLASTPEEINAILASGTALVFQARHGGEVVSSKMVYAIDERYAYYDSGGTSKAGMDVGASHLLMFSIMQAMHARGIATLNLDVASKAAGGLARFKKDFGAEEWEVDRVVCDVGNVRRTLTNGLRTLRRRFF
jgi:hypothetical protein